MSENTANNEFPVERPCRVCGHQPTWVVGLGATITMDNKIIAYAKLLCHSCGDLRTLREDVGELIELYSQLEAPDFVEVD